MSYSSRNGIGLQVDAHAKRLHLAALLLDHAGVHKPEFWCDRQRKGSAPAIPPPTMRTGAVIVSDVQDTVSPAPCRRMSNR